MTAAEFLERLDGVKANGKGWQARCPAHLDDKPSLSVAEGEGGRVLLHCHAGCGVADVVGMLGLELADLMPASDPALIVAPPEPLRRAAPKTFTAEQVAASVEALFASEGARQRVVDEYRFPEDAVRQFGIGFVKLDGRRWVSYPYQRGGGYSYAKLRSLDGDKAFRRWPAGVEAHLYGIDGVTSDDPVIVVEGERDAVAAHVLRLHLEVGGSGGCAVVSLPDGANPSARVLEHAREALAGCPKVYLWTDRDEAGDAAAEALAAVLGPGRCLRVRLPHHKDLGDLLADLGADKGLEVALEAVRSATPAARTQRNEEYEEFPSTPSRGNEEYEEFPGGDGNSSYVSSSPDSGKRNSSYCSSPPASHPVLDEAALHGPVGQFVRELRPYTEASDASLLFQALAAYGASLGRGPYFLAEATRHHANLFLVVVGLSSAARKGTSLDHVLRLMSFVDVTLTVNPGGLSSGEGLINALRDPSGEGEHADPGVLDKRLCLIEPEFQQVLAQTERSGNTLSPTLRQAWDGRPLQVLTRKNGLKATDPHVSIVAHITVEELRRKLNQTEAVNGYANRHLFCFTHRVRSLPEPEPLEDLFYDTHARPLRAAAVEGAKDGRIGRTPAARALWHEVYEELTAGRPGMVGSVTARGAAQVVRLSLLYALADGRREIDAVHLEAALAAWRYAERSAELVWGTSTGDVIADRILTWLRQAGAEGLSRTDLYQGLQNNFEKRRLDMALSLLADAKLAYRVAVRRAQRGPEQDRWYAGQPSQAKGA